ncbi:hypothetical protein F4779DRAFT_615023 [Xylariaceae sp. FL0662B]|nr:hypothetical protein F4779DRAFT_615023 [Xylariaceae sp. FL0662B]
MMNVNPQALVESFAGVGLVLWLMRLLFQLYWNFCRLRVIEIKGYYVNQHIVGVLCVLCSICLTYVFQEVCYWVVAKYLAPVPSKSVTLIVAPHLSTFFAVLFFGQTCLYHGIFRGSLVCWITLGGVVIISAIEGIIISRLDASDLENMCPDQFIVTGRMTIIVLLLIAAYFPLCVESWEHRGRAISVAPLVLAFGMLGNIFLTLSLLFQALQNESRLGLSAYLGIVLFATIAYLEGCLLCSHLIWMFRARRDRGLARRLRVTFDDLVLASELQGTPIEFAASFKPWVPYRVVDWEILRQLIGWDDLRDRLRSFRRTPAEPDHQQPDDLFAHVPDPAAAAVPVPMPVHVAAAHHAPEGQQENIPLQVLRPGTPYPADFR